MDAGQRLPRARCRPRRPGGRHGRGPRSPRRPAPGPGRARGARRVAVRLLHARVRLLDGRRVLPARPRGLRPPRHRRQPLPLHGLPADPRRGGRARRRPRGRPVRRALHERRARERAHPARRLRPSGRPPRGPRPAGRAPGRDRGRRLHRLGRRGQPPRPPGVVRRRGRPVARAARACRRSATTIEIGAALTLSEVEAGLGGSVPLLEQVLAALRVAADPQRRDHRRQPRHRLADRRPGAGPARPGGDARARLGRRGPRGRPRGLLHRLPRDACSAPTS